MANLLQDVQYVTPQEATRKFKKTKKRLRLTLNNLDDFAYTYQLTSWEYNLVKSVDIQRMNFSEIARGLGCTRQYVNQEYARVYTKVTTLGYTCNAE